MVGNVARTTRRSELRCLPPGRDFASERILDRIHKARKFDRSDVAVPQRPIHTASRVRRRRRSWDREGRNRVLNSAFSGVGLDSIRGESTYSADRARPAKLKAPVSARLEGELR